jgi:hypothetical protein
MAVNREQPLNGVGPLTQQAHILKHIQPISGISANYIKFGNM